METFEIGKFYPVPTVRGLLYHIKRDWPVLGVKHEDRKLIGFPYPHYHIDWRFVPKAIVGRVTRSRPSGLYGLPLHESEILNPRLPAPIMRRLKYQRAFWEYPAFVFRKLEAAYAGCTMKDMTCPHRGLPLAGCPQAGDVITCVGHGLRWNMKTGELVRTPV